MLPTFLAEYDKLARQCAARNETHVQYLLRLSELELIERERRMIERRINVAKFPAVKSLDSFEFTVIPSLNKLLSVGQDGGRNLHLYEQAFQMVVRLVSRRRVIPRSDVRITVLQPEQQLYDRDLAG